MGIQSTRIISCFLFLIVHAMGRELASDVDNVVKFGVADANPPENLRGYVAEGPSSSKGMMMYRRKQDGGSEIGGSVIIGGLMSVCLAVLYFYIRATRHRKGHMDGLLK
ncbi:hypothetical protein Droror1_Dr00003069 [Drosera rotundifolia]